MPLIKIPDNDDDNYECSFTQLLLKDPVKASDGKNYERSEIMKFMGTVFPQKAVSPLNRAPLEAELISNDKIRIKIDLFLKENNICKFEEFIGAVRHGDLEKLQKLNYIYDHLIATNIDGDTPLHVAVSQGHENVAEFLLKEGVFPTQNENNGNTLLHCAVFSGKESMLRMVLSTNYGKQITPNIEGLLPIHLAAQLGYVSILKALLEVVENAEERKKLLHKITVKEGDNILNIAVHFYQFEMVKYLFLVEGLSPLRPNYVGSTALSLAKGLQELVQHSVPIYRLLSNSILLYAAINESAEVCALLVQQGLFPKKCDTEYNQVVSRVDSQGRTALHTAVEKDDSLAIEILLENDADPHLVDANGITPFQLATSPGAKRVLCLYGLPQVESPPERFLCARSKRLMDIPGKASNGCIYDWSQLIKWTSECSQDPSKLTMPIANIQVEKQPLLRNEIQDFKKRHKIVSPENFVDNLLSGDYRKIRELHILHYYVELVVAGVPLLQYVTHNGKISQVSILLELGVPPDAGANGGSNTAMHIATAAGNVKIVQLLHRKGGKQFFNNDGMYPVHLAVINNRQNVLDFLFQIEPAMVNYQQIVIIKRGPSLHGIKGKTPLHLAAEKENADMIEFLLDHNAEPLISDERGVPAIYKLPVLSSFLIQEKRRGRILELMRDRNSVLINMPCEIWFNPSKHFFFYSPLMMLALIFFRNHDVLTDFVSSNENFMKHLTLAILFKKAPDECSFKGSLFYLFSRTNEGCAFIRNILLANLNLLKVSGNTNLCRQLGENLCTEIAEHGRSETAHSWFISYTNGQLLLEDLVREIPNFSTYVTPKIAQLFPKLPSSPLINDPHAFAIKLFKMLTECVFKDKQFFNDSTRVDFLEKNLFYLLRAKLFPEFFNFIRKQLFAIENEELSSLLSRSTVKVFGISYDALKDAIEVFIKSKNADQLNVSSFLPAP